MAGNPVFQRQEGKKDSSNSRIARPKRAMSVQVSPPQSPHRSLPTAVSSPHRMAHRACPRPRPGGTKMPCKGMFLKVTSPRILQGFKDLSQSLHYRFLRPSITASSALPVSMPTPIPADYRTLDNPPLLPFSNAIALGYAGNCNGKLRDELLGREVFQHPVAGAGTDRAEGQRACPGWAAS